MMLYFKMFSLRRDNNNNNWYVDVIKAIIASLQFCQVTDNFGGRVHTFLVYSSFIRGYVILYILK